MVDTPLNWTDPNSNELGYNVYRSETDIRADVPGAPIATTAANVTTYNDTFPDRAKIFNYRVGTSKGEPQKKEWMSPQVKQIAGGWDVYADFEKDRYFDKFLQASPSVLSYVTDGNWPGGMVEGADGTWTSYPANTLVKNANGVYTIPQRNNYIARSDMAGAVVGVLGSGGALPTGWSWNVSNGYFTLEVKGFGTSYGLPYIDLRMSGINTSGAAFYPTIGMLGTNTSVSDDQQFCISTYYEFLSVIDAGPAASVGAFSHRPGMQCSMFTTPSSQHLRANFVNLSGRHRAQNTYTVAAGTGTQAMGTPRIQSDVPNGGALDYTIRIWAPQLELNPFATPPIITAGGVAARGGNRPTIELAGRINPQGVAGFIKLSVLNSMAYTDNKFFTLGGRTSNDRFFIGASRGNMTALSFGLIGNGSSLASIGLTGMPVGDLTLVFACGPTYRRFGIVGVANSAASTNAVTFPQLSSFVLGSRPSDTAESNHQITKKLGLILGSAVQPVNAALYDRVLAMATEESVMPVTLL